MSGPSGAGKGTIVSRLVADDPRLWLSRSWTTRARRQGEADDAYVWVDEDAFRRRVDAGGFLEWAEVYGDLKGTPTPEPPSDRDVVLEIDLQGAHQIRRLHPDALIVFIAPPSRAEQERRLRSRGDPERDVLRRLAKADAEEEEGRALADAVVVNDDVDRAVAEIQELIASRR